MNQKRRDVVLLGAGHAHHVVRQAFARQPMDGVSEDGGLGGWRGWLTARVRGDTSPSERVGASTSYADVMASLIVLAWVVEARDPYTGGHLWRVSRYSQLLAQASGLPSDEVARIAVGALVHDLGKIGVADAILLKPDRLTADEYDVMKTHPEIGVHMLAGHPLAALVRDIVLQHHERPDGMGYPHGRSGDALPVAVRIVGIADAFDAMTSRRPFRDGMPVPRALELMQHDAKTQFDAPLLHRFADLGRAGMLEHVRSHSDDGIPLDACPVCGPTVVVRREQEAGDAAYCPNCANAFVLVEQSGRLTAMPTGARGTPADLAPRADEALIRRLVQEAVRSLPLEALQRHGLAVQV